MSSLKRKRNLLDDKQKREIISYAKENPKLTQQQIANNLTIKWDIPIKRTVGDIFHVSVCRLINYACSSRTTFLRQLIKLQFLLRIKSNH
jgi:hypothetical protein